MKPFLLALLLIVWNGERTEFSQWYESQYVPGTSMRCCDDADGATAEEDIKDGHYWVTFLAKGQTQGPMLVPDDRVLEGPNPRHVPVVWWGEMNNVIYIRCFAPGSKV